MHKTITKLWHEVINIKIKNKSKRKTGFRFRFYFVLLISQICLHSI